MPQFKTPEEELDFLRTHIAKKEQELLREFSIAVSESQCTIFFSYSKATDPSNAYPYETNYGFTHEYLKAPGSTLAGMK